MKEFKLIPYDNKNTWDEALSVYIFIEIIKNNTSIEDFSLDNYLKMELWDDSITEYHEWLDNDGNKNEAIIDFLNFHSEKIQFFSNNFSELFKPKVTFWRDRKKTEYFKTKLQEAFEFENFIAQKIKVEYDYDIEPYLTPEGQYDLGENALGIEIKNDKILKKTRNIYIEVAEKSNKLLNKYTKSGILKNDETIYFLLGDYDEFYIFFKNKLLSIYKEELKLFREGKPSKRGIKFKIISTSQGFIFPIKNAVAESITFDEMMEDIIRRKK